MERRSGKIRDRRKLNRVGSMAPPINEVTAQTIAGRLTSRRLALKLTQKQVSDRVKLVAKSGRHKGIERTLSRNAYAMYELGASEPDLQKIEAVARALNVEPGWLAFGSEGADKPREPFQTGTDLVLLLPCALSLNVTIGAVQFSV